MGPVAKKVAFLMCNEKVGTRYRGHRLMPGRYESDLCPRCQDQRETQTHRYGRCPIVVRAWEQARAVIEDMEPELEQVPNKNMLHLFYPRVERETVLFQVDIESKSSSGSYFLCKYLALSLSKMFGLYELYISGSETLLFFILFGVIFFY